MAGKEGQLVALFCLECLVKTFKALIRIISTFLFPQSLMDQYFARMRSLMSSKELPARIRFLLQV